MFQLNNERVKLVHMNIRTEKHGEDDVRAVDLKFERIGSSAILDEILPGIRPALYRGGQPGNQVDAFNGELTTLAFPDLEMPLKVSGEWPGYVASIVTGFDLGDALVLIGELKKSRVEAVAGGSAKHEFTLSTYPEDGDIARLAAALGRAVELTLTAPGPTPVGDDDEAGEDREAA